MELPYFKLYVIDFQHGTLKMSVTQKGGYLNMLIYQWDKGGLPQDRDQLLEISELNDKNLTKVLKKFFLDTDGLWKNSRLEKERLSASKVKTVNSLNGSKGGKKRAENSSGRYNSLGENQAVVKRGSSILESELQLELESEVDSSDRHNSKAFVNANNKAHLVRYFESGEGDENRATRQAVISLYRHLNIHNDTDLRVWAIRFNLQLGAEGKNHPTLEEWQSHFKNWIPKAPKEENYSPQGPTARKKLN